DRPQPSAAGRDRYWTRPTAARVRAFGAVPCRGIRDRVGRPCAALAVARRRGARRDGAHARRRPCPAHPRHRFHPAYGPRMKTEVRAGRYGEFGGQYLPETLMPAVAELERAWLDARADRDF